MVKDPVCGMMIDPQKAAGSTQYQGKTYYFCSTGCKTEFDRNPEKFVARGSTVQTSGPHEH